MCLRETDNEKDRQTERKSESESRHRDTAPHSGAALYSLQKARGNIKKFQHKLSFIYVS